MLPALCVLRSLGGVVVGAALSFQEEHRLQLIALLLWELSQAEHMWEGEGSRWPSLHQSSSLPITEESSSFLLSPGAVCLQSVRVTQHLVIEKKNEEDVQAQQESCTWPQETAC